LQQLATDASMDLSRSPLLAQSTQQQLRRRLPLVAISVLLVVLLAAGGIVAAFARSAGTDKTTNISAATAGSGGIAQATATSNTTKNEQDHHNATATATVQAQATSGVTATAIPTPSPKASTTASSGPDQLYNIVTSASPTWSDPLSAQDNNNWTVSAYCSFSGGTYHITATVIKTVKSCYAGSTYFCNMAIQVQITNFSGQGGGIRFRATPDGSKVYGFIVKPEGAYQFGGPSGGIIPYTLASSSAIHTGYNVSNVITIIARGSNFYFYVNQQYLASASNSSLACGEIGLYVLDWTSSASVSFSSAKVWKL
jgi:hypothetical protein